MYPYLNSISSASFLDISLNTTRLFDSKYSTCSLTVYEGLYVCMIFHPLYVKILECTGKSS